MRRTISLLLLVAVLAALVPVAPRAAQALELCGPAIAPWVLAPASRTVRAVEVERVDGAGGVENAAGLLGGGRAVLQRAGGNDPSVVLDFGTVVSGTLRVSAASPDGSTLSVAFSESLQYLSRESDVQFGEHFTWSWPLAGERQTVESGQVTFRYLLLFLPGDGRVEIDDLSLHFTPFLGTPDTFAGCFLSSDAELNRIWYAGAYTLDLVTTETADGATVVYDGAKRDRDIWIGDLALEANLEYLIHNRPEGVRESLERMVVRQREDGQIPPSSFMDYTLIMFDYSAWWVVAFAQYWGRTGDTAFAERYYPNMLVQLDWFAGHTNARGLIYKDFGIEWCFWLGRSGEVTYLNAVYYKALLEAATLADGLGRAADARTFRERAAGIRAAMNAHLFDPARGAYVDSGDDRAHIPQDGNALAVLYGIAEPQHVPGILDYLKRTMWTPYGSTNVDVPYGHDLFHDKRIWPFMNYYELEARFEAGNDADAFDLLRRTWGHMLRSDPGSTMWEWMSADGRIENGYASLAHGWSAGATGTLTERVLGIRYQGPQYTTFDAIPHPGTLDWAQGRVPTPRGNIDLAWQRDAATFDMQLVVPPGSRARAGVPHFERPVTVLVDGEPVWHDGRSLARGARIDGGYVMLDLGPGTHHVVATTDWLRYAETGQTLSGAFKTFWERSGGLPVFGYPLTAEAPEEGTTVQYFERQRFELHPEYRGTPYEVLLGLLGSDEAGRRGLRDEPAFAPLAESARRDDCLYFAETGHQVCHGFRGYWESHGLEFGDVGVTYRESLALFGYPISEEFVDPATGLTTQYFERARFEFHPQHPPEWQVLLGRVGATLLDSRVPANGTIAPLAH